MPSFGVLQSKQSNLISKIIDVSLCNTMDLIAILLSDYSVIVFRTLTWYDFEHVYYIIASGVLLLQFVSIIIFFINSGMKPIMIYIILLNITVFIF